MYTLLCNLCQGTTQLNHSNWLGFIGFGIVVFMLFYTEKKKHQK